MYVALVSWFSPRFAKADESYSRKLQVGVYDSRCCEQTPRQLLEAHESLALVRRLLVPMQIDIGQNHSDPST